MTIVRTDTSVPLSSAGLPLTAANGKTLADPMFFAQLTNSLIPIIAVDGAYTSSRISAATVTDFEGLVKATLAEEARFEGARRVENLATGVVTETITVVNGCEYQVTIAGGSGDTCVASGAFTGTLTANGTNRISWNSGTPKTAGSTSLTLTVTGTLIEMLVEDVTGQGNQNPSENIVIGAEHGTNVGNVKCFNYQNNNTVDGSGVVTEAPGSVISAAILKSVQIEAQNTNDIVDSGDLTSVNWFGTAFAVMDETGPDGRLNSAATVTDNDVLKAESRAINSTVTANVNYTFSVFLKKGTLDRNALVIRDDTVKVNVFEVNIDWTVGVPTVSNNLGSGVIHAVEGPFKNDFYRIAITDKLPVASTSLQARIIPSDIDEVTDLGTVIAYGAQLELGEFPSSYIFTSGAAATRTIDSLNYPITNGSEAEGTLYCEWIPDLDKADYAGVDAPLIVMDDTAVQGVLYIQSAAGAVASYDGTTAHTNTESYSAGDTVKIGLRWSESDSTFNIVVNGVAATEAAFDGWDVARWDDAIHMLRDGIAYGAIKNPELWNVPLTDVELASKTS